MYSNQFPFFERGNILKKELLRNLRDYPRNLIDLYFLDYSEGVLTGSDLEIEGQEIVINPGLIKFSNRIYLLTTAQRIKYQPSNQQMIIKIKFSEEEKNSDFKSWKSTLLLEQGVDLAEDELELGRFKLREGAKLRTDYHQFSDFSTEYNTVNIIHVKYSSLEEYTLHPAIINFFATKILNSSTENQLDISFALQALQARRIQRDLLCNYLTKKLKLKQDNYSNLEIYRYLGQIIRQLSKQQVKNVEVKSDNKILID